MQVYPEGTHFMIPWFDRPVIYDVRARPNIVESTSGSRDLQMVRDTVLGRIFLSGNDDVLGSSTIFVEFGFCFCWKGFGDGWCYNLRWRRLQLNLVGWIFVRRSGLLCEC